MSLRALNGGVSFLGSANERNAFESLLLAAGSLRYGIQNNASLQSRGTGVPNLTLSQVSPLLA